MYVTLPQTSIIAKIINFVYFRLKRVLLLFKFLTFSNQLMEKGKNKKKYFNFC